MECGRPPLPQFTRIVCAGLVAALSAMLTSVPGVALAGGPNASCPNPLLNAALVINQATPGCRTNAVYLVDNASLVIEDRGFLEAPALWQSSFPSPGSSAISIRGRGSRLDIRGELVAGQTSQAHALFTVSDQGSVSSGDTILGYHAFSHVEAVVRDAWSKWTNTGVFDVGGRFAGGRARLRVLEGGWVGSEILNVGTASGRLSVVPDVEIRGSQTIQGWAGPLRVPAQLEAALVVIGNGPNTGVLEIAEGGSLIATALELRAGRTEVRDRFSVLDAERLTIGGALDQGGLEAVLSADLEGLVWVRDRLLVDVRGELRLGQAGVSVGPDTPLRPLALGSLMLGAGGSLGGGGKIIGDVISTGLLAPAVWHDDAVRPGDLSIDGNLILERQPPTLPDPVLELVIAGTVPGYDHDEITVLAPAQLAGTLRLLGPRDLPDRLMPQDRLVVMVASSIWGEFENAPSGERLDVLPLDPSTDGAEPVGSFAVHYGEDSPYRSDWMVLSDFSPPVSQLTANPAPEPGASALGVAAFIALATLHQRRRSDSRHVH